MPFRSILYPVENVPTLPDNVPAPACFTDLNLDQIVGAINSGRDEYNLKPFFHAPVPDLDTIQYRHEVMKDLEQEDVLGFVTRFSAKMRSMREQITKLNKLYYRLQKEAVFLDAIAFYCEALSQLAHNLGTANLTSRGMTGFRDHVEAYVQSAAFTSLEDTMNSTKADLSKVVYSLLIRYTSVTVKRPGSEPDYSAAIEATFARFRQGGAKSFDFKLPDFFEMNHIEAGILDFVVRLYPEVFSRLHRYFQDNQSYLDPIIGRWDREIQFYVAYLDYIRPMKRMGLRFCYPTISADSKAVHCTQTFDIALAHKLVGGNAPVITNDFELGGHERIFIVSGPNQGGKTTFARTFGQLHYLGRLGCPIPGREATLFFFDRLLTHFEKEEDIHNHRGKLEDDLVRIHAILREATPNSIVILNEIFTSTTLHDALFLGRRVLERLIDLDLICVCVTFMDELSSLGPQIVSLVSTVVPENPAERTFRVVRRTADGRSYAMSIAEKYRVTYDSLRERLAS